MSTDDTREALAAMVREGKAAGMYAPDHGSAGFCTNHGQAAARPTIAEITTADVRLGFALSKDNRDPRSHDARYDPDAHAATWEAIRDRACDEFDTWLAEHDLQVLGRAVWSAPADATVTRKAVEVAARAASDVRWNHALPHASRGGPTWTDAEMAAAVLTAVGYADLLGEVKRLRRIVDGYDRTPAEQRAAAAEAEVERLRATVARVEAQVASHWGPGGRVPVETLADALHPTVTDTPTKGGAR